MNQPTCLEEWAALLTNKLEAAAGEIVDLGCTCVDRPDGGHAPGCQGVVSAQPYYDLVDRARGRTRANVGATLAAPCATDVPATRSRQTQDYIDIQDAFDRFKDRLGRPRWYVVRRGFPAARIRVLAITASEAAANDRFEAERIKMRQGLLAVVDPLCRIVKYASEPMVRIPSDSDQRSELIPIAIPNSCRSPFQSDGDHRSKLMPITVRRG